MTLFAILIVLTLAKDASAWGLATHVELANNILSDASILATAGGAVLLKHGKDFLLGNILADVIVAKKVSRRRQQSHHWNAGVRLLQNSNSEENHAFAYGFLSHLAADTVAHNEFIPKQIVLAGSTVSLGHLYWELRADHLSTSNRGELNHLIRSRSLLHEESLEAYVYPKLVSFGFNRAIFANLSLFAHSKKFGRAMQVCNDVSVNPLSRVKLESYKSRAIERMADVITNGMRSKVLREDPNGKLILDNIKLSRRKRRSDILL